MSIETDLSSIAKHLETIVDHIIRTQDAAAIAVSQVKASVVEVPKQAIPSAPIPSMQESVGNPPIPTDTVTSLVSPTFTDAAGLTAYVMDAYKKLGPIKGAKIQEVLQSVGAKNINEVKPEHYATVKAGVDALGV